MPLAGNRNNSSGTVNNEGSNGNYWSSTVDGINARNLNFNSSNASENSNNRANGMSVRCIKDEWPVSAKAEIKGRKSTFEGNEPKHQFRVGWD